MLDRGLVGLCSLGFVLGGIIQFARGGGGNDSERFIFVFESIQNLSVIAIFLGLAGSFVWTQPWLGKNRIAILIVLLFVGIGLSFGGHAYTFYLLFAVFLPTLVHTHFFTGTFLLQGAMKNKSPLGLACFFTFVACSIGIFLVPVWPMKDDLADGWIYAYSATLAYLNKEILELLSHQAIVASDLFKSTNGILVARLIAFAYTYHYLNWFSKTTVIRWHRVSRSRLWIVIGGWMVMMAVYFIDFGLGLFLVGFVGLLHVFMEFPLDAISVVGLFRELRLKIRKAGI